jgi:type II secretory pathway component PulM
MRSFNNDAVRRTRAMPFDKHRKRILHRLQRMRAQLASLKNRAAEVASTSVASLKMHDEGGPLRNGD